MARSNHVGAAFLCTGDDACQGVADDVTKLEVDSALFRHLKPKVVPQVFLLRWLRLLFARESAPEIGCDASLLAKNNNNLASQAWLSSLTPRNQPKG